jgi:S-adenosylmethionine decarboxylase
LSIDVFSCKDFDVQTAVGFATKVFGITSQEVKIVDRGLEFPRDMGAVTQFMTDERKEMRA